MITVKTVQGGGGAGPRRPGPPWNSKCRLCLSWRTGTSENGSAASLKSEIEIEKTNFEDHVVSCTQTVNTCTFSSYVNFYKS